MRPLALPSLLLALLLLAAGQALAIEGEPILQIAYTDLDGVAQTRNYTTGNPWTRPASDFAVMVTAALGQRARIVLQRLTPTGPVTEATYDSPTIAGTDVVTFQSVDYPGLVMTVPAPASDGPYQLVTYKTVFNALTGTWSQMGPSSVWALGVDRTPPQPVTTTKWEAWRPTTNDLADDALIGFYDAKVLERSVEDPLSGLDFTTARFESIWVDGPNAGTAFYSAAPTFGPTPGDPRVAYRLSIGTGAPNSVLPGTHFPNQHGRYIARFRVRDRAGNVATLDKPVHWFANCDAASSVEMFAVYDPYSNANPVAGSPFTGFVPYVPGMEVKTNPVRMLLRVPRANWWEDSTYGLSIGHADPPNVNFPEDPADFRDANYAYEEVRFAYVPPGTSLYPDVRVASPTTWGCPDPPLSPNLQLAAAPVNPFAQILLELAYVDPYGVSKTAGPDDSYLNPQGTMEVAVTGGIGHRVILKLYRDTVAAPNLVATVTTPQITSADRVSVDGRSYYGHTALLDAPAEDGRYHLQAEIRNSVGALVAVENWERILDRTPPAATGGFGWAGWRPLSLQPMPDNTLIGWFEAKRLWLSGLVDDGAGIDATPGRARFQSLWLTGPNAGSVALETPATLSVATAEVSIGTGAQYTVRPGVHFPDESGHYLARFIVHDRAGNVATFDKPLHWFANCSVAQDVEMFAVYDPDDTNNLVPGSPYTGFVPYVPGMTVKTNPVRMLLRVPRTSWWEDATYGVSFFHFAPPTPDFPLNPADFRDANYAYEEISFGYVPPGTSLNPDYRIASPTTWNCTAFPLVPNLLLDPSALPEPKAISFTAVWDDIGAQTATPEQVIRRRTNTQATLLSMRVEVEPRPYEQTYKSMLIGECVIPPGETGCSVDNPMVFGDTPEQMEMRNPYSKVFGPDGIATGSLVYRFEFDLNVPTVQSAVLSADRRRVDLVITEFMTGAWSGLVKLTAAWLEAEAADGTVRTVNATGLAGIDADLTWAASVSLATLPGGRYTLRFYARDFYNNVSAPFVINNHVHDLTAPTVDLYTTLGGPLAGARISSINQIRFKVADDVDTTPTVTAARLTGGPLGDDIHLAFYKVGTEYRVEAPIMPPSVDPADYTLAVTVRDDSGNSRTVSASFEYAVIPFGLVPANGADITLPIIDLPTRLMNGNWPLTSTLAIHQDAGGTPVIATADLFITLSADAQGALMIGTLRINPGQTVTFQNYNFAANESALKLPLHFADPAAVSPGRFGGLIIEINLPETPVFMEDIVAWTPADSIVPVQSQPSFAKRVEPALLRLQSGGDDRCPLLVAQLEGDSYNNIRYGEDVAVCAVRWTALPPALAPARLDTARVYGLIESDADAVSAGYQPGLLIRRQGTFAFFPVGAPVDHQIALHDPDPPLISIGTSGDRADQVVWLPDGEFPTGVGAVVPGFANVRAAFPGLDLSITELTSGRVQFEQPFSSNVARAPIETNIADIEGRQSFRIDARYTNYPAISASATVTFVALPKKPMIQIARPVDPNNWTDTVVQGRFGLAALGEFSYDAATLGTWVIRVYKQQVGAGGSKTRVQLGSDTSAIAADGSFSVNLGVLEPGVYAMLATATLQTADPAIEGVVESLPTVVKVFDGDPVTFELKTSRDTGLAPMTATVKLALTDIKRAGDVVRIDWERSTDGVTFTPIERDARYSRSFGYGERLADPGEYWYRATTVNRFSGAPFTAPAIKVHVYDAPKFSLSGYNFTFTGHAVEWRAVSEDPTRPALFRWSVRPGSYKAEPLLLDGPVQTFDASVNGSWYIAVEGRYADAPDVRGAWRKVSALLKVAPPYMVRPRIVGPNFVETGKSYEYRAQTYAVTRGNADPNIRVVGRWDLPDGTTSDQESITYTVRPGDSEIRYTAWVDGYRAETEQTTALALRPWEYVFPEFRLYKRLVREYDPVQVSYSVVATRTATGGEVPIYDWSLPAGVTTSHPNSTTALVSAYAAGDYPIAVRAYDTRGNETVLADTLSVRDPPPLAADLKLLVGDAWNRAPARVTARWYVSGMLSSERVSEVTLNLDGALLSDRVLSSYSLNVADVGQHSVDVALRTNYGRAASYSATFDLIAGVLPVCTILTQGDALASLRAQASCQVEMGRIIGYRWWVTYADTGETRDLGLRSSTIYFAASELARGISQVRLVVVNDKGQESLPAVWNR